VIVPASKRALFSHAVILFTKNMLAIEKCPLCESRDLLRGELIEPDSSP
jgi:hypothetical protein